ncbi:prepilin-type N-terminal cleavage/methylation domain-containing protein [Deinococcus humi]|uniref:prepilin-type N-terminal cleavage/methylation domain-containing protein n=1 Tax=Deinococcus humi TaxID=662880 RepID=UPI001610460D|nr:prepilin-type N-terminal cleavage/methylation domain-containing protein [Deinococcus humi]
MKRATGFTLLELLIVVGVLALLMTVLTPTLVSARNRANDAASSIYIRNCVNSLESIRNGLTGKFDVAPSTCHDNALGEARLVPSASVISSSISIDSTRSDYLITVKSKTGKVFKHDGHTFIADNG